MEKEKNRKFICMFIIGYLGYSVIYVARLNFSTAATLFEQLGTLDKTQISLIGSVFSLVYALAKLLNGYIGDRFSAKSVMVCGLTIVGISNLLIGIFPHFISILILWGANAYGQSMLWGPLLRIYSENFDAKKFKIVSNLLSSSIAVGSIAGLLLASACISAGSAAACFLIPSAITLIVASVIRLFFLDARSSEKKAQVGIRQAFAVLLGEKNFHWIVFPAVAHGIIKDNVNVWMAMYVVDTFGIDLKAIAGYVFVIPLLVLRGDFYILYFIVCGEMSIRCPYFRFACA